MTLSDQKPGHVRSTVLTFLSELYVESLCHHGKGQFVHAFGESLTKTNAFAPTEWYPAHRVPLLSIRSQSQRVLRIKTIRKEVIWSLPLLRITMQSVDVDRERVTCFDSQFAHLNVLFLKKI